MMHLNLILAGIHDEKSAWEETGAPSCSGQCCAGHTSHMRMLEPFRRCAGKAEGTTTTTAGATTTAVPVGETYPTGPPVSTTV